MDQAENQKSQSKNYKYQIKTLRELKEELKDLDMVSGYGPWYLKIKILGLEIFGEGSNEAIMLSGLLELFKESQERIPIGVGSMQARAAHNDAFRTLSANVVQNMIKILELRKNNSNGGKRWFFMNFNPDGMNLSWSLVATFFAAVGGLGFYFASVKTDLDKNKLTEENRSYKIQIDSLNVRVKKDSFQLQQLKDEQKKQKDKNNKK